MNNDQDVHDASEILAQNRRLTFWCMGKRNAGCESDQDSDDSEDTELATKRRHNVLVVDQALAI